MKHYWRAQQQVPFGDDKQINKLLDDKQINKLLDDKQINKLPVVIY